MRTCQLLAQGSHRLTASLNQCCAAAGVCGRALQGSHRPDQPRKVCCALQRKPGQPGSLLEQAGRPAGPRLAQEGASCCCMPVQAEHHHMLTHLLCHCTQGSQQHASWNFDRSKGAVATAWFKGWQTNLSFNCLDRHIEQGRGDAPCLLWEGNDPGQERTLSYAQTLAEVCSLVRFMLLIRSC